MSDNVCVFVLLGDDGALWQIRITDLCIADAGVINDTIGADALLIPIANLDNHTRVLSEEHLDDVFTCGVVKVDVHTALTVGEARISRRVVIRPAAEMS